MIGVAVGLGNVWRFPYMMGSYGGSAFLAVYLMFTVAFAFPALMAEMALGRAARGGVFVAFTKAAGPRLGKAIAVILLTTVIIAGSYYAVVIANLAYTAAFSLFIGFKHENLTEFESSLSNPWLQYAITMGLIFTSFYVIHRGLRKGIERISTIVVPFFLLVILYLIVYTLNLPGAFDQLIAFLRPDFSVMTPTDVFAALGQSFFSVGLGGTFIVVYGSFIKDKRSIPRLAITTVFGDLGASLLVSLFLVPAILVLGMDIGSGPGLIFNTLPRMFSVMPMGRVVGSLFLLALVAVAFLSLIAAYQVPVTSFQQLIIPGITRNHIIIGLALIQAGLSLPSCIYPELIGILDLIFGSGMQVFGSALAVIGVVWGLGKEKLLFQLFGHAKHGTIGMITFRWLRYVVPVVLFAVLVGYIYSSVVN
jgi:NSS family neurotransmitter:Na+ symporter